MKLSRDNRAASQTVAVILLLAVTIAMSATVGVVVLDIGQEASEDQSPSSDVGMAVFENADGSVDAQVRVGDTDNITVLVNGNQETSQTDVSSGDEISVGPQQSGTNITYVAGTGQDRRVITNFQTDGAADSSVSISGDPTLTQN